MKFGSFLALAAALTTVVAVPVADSLDAEPVAVQLDARAADEARSPFDVELSDDIQARDLTRGQCKAACDKGADAVEAFCRRLPKLDLRTRAACWAASTAVQSPIGQRACVAFCDAWF